jgi:hypothetical protein
MVSLAPPDRSDGRLGVTAVMRVGNTARIVPGRVFIGVDIQNESYH